tara:strand:- start:235 stop:801 length:567 start_codon:yes stop_codon:yes gene_type:complete
MPLGFPSILLLTILLAIGLLFFLRAASKDRTTVVDVRSPLPPLIILDGISDWLEQRGWRRDGGDADRHLLKFQGSVAASGTLAILLSILGGVGSGCLGLVLRQLYPFMDWWPLSLVFLGGPAAGLIYKKRAERIEFLEMRLMNPETVEENDGTLIRIRAHRDELIAIELELASSLKLASDGSLLSSPI